MGWRHVVENQKKAAEAEVDYDYTLRPILLLVPTGNPPMTDARRKDAEALRARFRSCSTGLPEARAQHDVVVLAPITKNSSDLVPALRDILNKVEAGHLTSPETTERGVELYAVCEKKEIKPTRENRAARLLREMRRRANIEFRPGCVIPLALPLDEAGTGSHGSRAPVP